MAKPKVVLAYPYGTFEPQFVRSLAHLLAYDSKHSRYVCDGGMIDYQTTNLPHGRNQIVTRFLERFPDIDWLWFVDTDQDFTPDTLDRLMASAHPTDRPIVGALIYSLDVANPGQQTWPTVWSWTDTGPARWSTAPRNRLLGPADGVAATGTGCVLIHRSVLEKLGAEHGGTAWPWFKYGEWTNAEGQPDIFGEDLTFMARAGALGFPVWVDTRVEVGHVKRQIVDTRTHVQTLPWDRTLTETYVVIPVKDRLDLTKRILRDLETQGGYDAVFVFDNGSGRDTRDWLRRQTIAEVFDATGANIHQMWNAGIREAVARWPKANVAVLNNDLHIGPDFLNGLARALRADDALIAVGPNYDGRTIDGPIQLVKGIAAGRYDGTGGLPGFAFMVRGEAFALGFPWFDEQLQWWFGDNDFLLEADRRGLVYGLCRDVTVEHVGGGSQSGAISADVIAADEQHFCDKWGGVKAGGRITVPGAVL